MAEGCPPIAIDIIGCLAICRFVLTSLLTWRGRVFLRRLGLVHGLRSALFHPLHQRVGAKSMVDLLVELDAALFER
jgi:hypothetical protein